MGIRERNRPDHVKQADLAVAARLRAQRMRMGISQADLGKELGVSFQQVQKYENGGNRISAGRLFVIAKFLHVPISYFFEDLEHEAYNELDLSAMERELDFVHFLSSLSGPRKNVLRNFARALVQTIEGEGAPPAAIPENPGKPPETDEAAAAPAVEVQESVSPLPQPTPPKPAPNVPAATRRRILNMAGKGKTAPEIAAAVMLSFQIVEDVLNHER